MARTEIGEDVTCIEAAIKLLLPEPGVVAELHILDKPRPCIHRKLYGGEYDEHYHTFIHPVSDGILGELVIRHLVRGKEEYVLTESNNVFCIDPEGLESWRQKREEGS